MPENKKMMEELFQLKGSIELSLKRSIEELEGLGLNLNDSLLDSGGFPRTDIDLYRVRLLKSSIARQQNDHNDLMKKIEALLPSLIPSKQLDNSADRSCSSNSSLVPFAKIGIVPTASFAYQASLCTNDLIVKFGELKKETFIGNDLGLIATEFARFRSLGQDMEITVKKLDNSLHTVKVDCKSVTSIGCQILLLQ